MATVKFPSCYITPFPDLLAQETSLLLGLFFFPLPMGVSGLLDEVVLLGLF